MQDHHCHRHYHTFHQEEAELEVNKKLLAKVFLLKDIWRTREPKVNYQQQQQHQQQQSTSFCFLIKLNKPLQARRLFCDSFVLSLRADEETVFCGLNNGCVQVQTRQGTSSHFQPIYQPYISKNIEWHCCPLQTHDLG